MRRGIAFATYGRFGCAVRGCFLISISFCLSAIGFNLQLTFKYSVVCTASALQVAFDGETFDLADFD